MQRVFVLFRTETDNKKLFITTTVIPSRAFIVVIKSHATIITIGMSVVSAAPVFQLIWKIFKSNKNYGRYQRKFIRFHCIKLAINNDETQLLSTNVAVNHK